MARQYIDLVSGSDTVATKTITGATRANPCVITSTAHGMGDGQVIGIASVGGMTQLNGLRFKIKNTTANTFELTDLSGVDINSTAFATYTSGGTITIWRKIAIQGITQANPAVVSAKGHGFNNGEVVVLEDVGGMTQVNDKFFTVANKTTDTFELSSINSSGFSAYTSGGTAQFPFKTQNVLSTYYSGTLQGFFYLGDTVVTKSTFRHDSSIQVGSGSIAFQRNSNEITTSVSLVGTVSSGDFIGLTTATLNGCLDSGDPTVTRPDIYYKVLTVAAAKITIETKYGGVDTTVSAINRLRIGTEVIATGSVSANAVSTTLTGITYEGGYDFIHNTAVGRTTGETAFKPATDTGDIYCWSLADTSSVVRYFGFMDAARGIVIAGTGNTVEYCFARSRQYYGFALQSASCAVNYCTGSQSDTYSNFYCNVAATTSYCYAVNNSQVTVSLQGVGARAYKCRAECGYGLNSTSTCIIESCLVNDCRTAATSSILLSGAGSYVVDTTIDGSINGIYIGTSVSSAKIKGCTITNNTTAGISSVQSFMLHIEDCSFSGNVVDIALDTYSSHINVWNCDTNTPTTWFVSRALGTDTVDIRDCTIDAPSVAKAYQIVSGASYNVPQYTLENSFGLSDGLYYANSSYVKDYTVYRTSGYSMKLVNNTTLTGVVAPIKMLSYGVNSGVGRTISYYLKRDASTWTGTITPRLRLGGTIIKTGSDITSLTTSWVQYTISVTGAEVTHDGELSLEFTNNSNNVAVWLDDPAIS